MLKSVWGIELLFAGEKKGTANDHTSLQIFGCQGPTQGAILCHTVNMLHQVHSKLLLSLGRMKNEGQPGLHLQGRITLVLQYWDAEKADVEMAEDGKTEGDDSNSDGHWQGRKLTQQKQGILIMAKMRSRDLCGQFVRRWALLTTMNAKTEDHDIV